MITRGQSATSGKVPLRGIRCPSCGMKVFQVLYTRAVSGERIARRRMCRQCQRRFTTYESAPIMQRRS